MKIFRNAAVLAAAAALLLTGCSSDKDAGPASDSIVVTDQWAKAMDQGMTSAFATLENTSGQDIQVVSAASPASSAVELHEVVDGTMSEMDGGFTVPAGASRTLSPGADHIMLMNLAEPVRPGADVEITLTYSDGSSSTFLAPARDFAGNIENYGESEMDHGGMDHGGMDHGNMGDGS